MAQNPLMMMKNDLENLKKSKAEYEIDKNNGHITFNPSPFLSSDDIKQEPLKNNAAVQNKMKDFLRLTNCDNIEGIYKDSGKDTIFTTDHGFIMAAVTAWSKHYPLIIKPSHIWLLILQAIATHVEQNAEQLRSKWVMHEGKKELSIFRNNFVKGSMDNDWEGVIEEFVQQIDSNTCENVVPLLKSDYSTSNSIDNIASKVTIMDICKSYFDYKVYTLCGFPKITLFGTKQDWILLKEKSEQVLKKQCEENFGSTWCKSLLPILDHFINAYDGNIDCLFWNSMIKKGAFHGSGGTSWYSGWINIFFPFEIDGKVNKYCVPYDDNNDYVKIGLNGADKISGLDVGNVPIGLASAPVIWQYFNQQIKLKFVAGFMGAKQDGKSLAIEANVGWFIAHEQEKKESHW